MLQALVDVGKRVGVEYRLSTTVSEVKLSSDRSRAEGVTFANGETLYADVILVNADLVYAYNNLLPHTPYATSLSKRPGSCSSLSFYWYVMSAHSCQGTTANSRSRAMDKVIPELETHNVFLASEFKDSFDDIFKRQSIPEEPSFYVNVPSRIDPSAAPEGKDSVVVLVPVGHLLKTAGQGPLADEIGLDPENQQDWERMINKAREAIFTTVESRTGANLRDSVITEMINEPYSWESKFNLDKGAILGLSHSFFNVLSFRPSTKHGSYKDLYFVGASTHPGTGVPIVLAGSKITTEQILKDTGMDQPCRSPQAGHASIKDIDRVQEPFSLSRLVLVLVLLVIAFTAYK